MDRRPPLIGKLDVLWLVFLAGLAVLSPIFEIQKQLVLLAFGIFQLFEGRLVERLPERGPVYSVLVKISLATLLLDHTGVIAINSSYYPIYYIAIVTAALYFRVGGTLFWTAVASLSYCFYLIPALKDYQLTASGASELGIRILFFFLAAILVNRFATENREQIERYRQLSESLAAANRQLQRAEADARRTERLAALGQLSAGLAHEIRNPLGVIKGSADLLRQQAANGEPLIRELAGYISSEVDRASALVARFLDFARPSRLELHEELVTKVLDSALEAARSQYPDAAITVERHYATAIAPVRLDHQLCERLFVNLILNAYEAINGRGGRLSLAVAAANSEKRPGVLVAIDDNGPGIPAQLEGQIFNPFFTSKKAGVGLGLSIAAKIADDHRGWIRLETGLAQGAHFRVFLPADPEG